MIYTREATCMEMRGYVLAVAATAPEGNRKAAINFAAKALHISYSMAKKLFYGEVICVEAHEADIIRLHAERMFDLIEARGEFERVRADFLRTHPGLACLLPRTSRRTEVPQVARAMVAVADGAAERVDKGAGI